MLLVDKLWIAFILILIPLFIFVICELNEPIIVNFCASEMQEFNGKMIHFLIIFLLKQFLFAIFMKY